MVLVIVLAFVVAVTAAIRSTWSPCGWSMLSTLTPLSERSRGNRFGRTGTWFVVGATLGGATLGLIGAAIAVGVAAWDPSRTATWAVVAAASTAAVALEMFGAGRLALPHHRRQVNELWLDQFRPWVYGMGFGAQIGFGLATYIMTAAVYLTVVMAGVTASPLVAVAVGTTFGFVRGLAVFASARCHTPQQLAAFHRRFESMTEPVRRTAIVVEAGVAITAAIVGWTVVGGAVVVVVVSLVIVVTELRRPLPETDVAGDGGGGGGTSVGPDIDGGSGGGQQVREPLPGILGDPSLGRVVHVRETEPGPEPLRPLEVVE